MERGLHIPSKGRKRSDKRKNQEAGLSIIKADYVNGFKVLILFSDKKQKIIDFYPLLSKTLQGYYTKYLLPANFKEFVVSNGNIFGEITRK